MHNNRSTANTDANEPFARRIQTSETVDLNQGNGRLNQAKQHQARFRKINRVNA